MMTENPIKWDSLPVAGLEVANVPNDAMVEVIVSLDDASVKLGTADTIVPKVKIISKIKNYIFIL